MSKFYFPFYYLFYSRLKTKIDLISWIIIFIVPQFLISFYYTELNFGSFILLFILSQIIFNTLYEIGYLENDVYTIKNENNPTLRLEQKRFDYIKSNYSKIIYFRYLIVFISLSLLYLINFYFDFGLNVMSFIVLLIINRLFFFFHNNIRNRWNLVTFSVLAVTKYIFPVILFVSMENMKYAILLSVITFPLLRIIEHSTHKRYSYKSYARIIGNHDRFRILYYLAVILSCVIFWLFSLINRENFTIAIWISAYFLLYRLVSYFFVKRGIYKRDLLKRKDLYNEA